MVLSGVGVRELMVLLGSAISACLRRRRPNKEKSFSLGRRREARKNDFAEKETMQQQTNNKEIVPT
jgi:hypothetical protein